MSGQILYRIYTTRLLLIAGALFFIPLKTATAEDANQMSARIRQLENQVQTLSRAVFRDEKIPAASSTSGSGGAASADFEVRLGEIEEKQRDITGQLEKLNYDIQQMKDRLEKALADYDMRFNQLEKSSNAQTEPSGPTVESEQQPAPASNQNTLGTISSSGPDPANTLYEDAFANIRDGKYDAAATKFQKFLENYPDHALASNAQYWLAETHYARGNYKQSAKMFAQGYQDFPKAPKAADSLLKLGLSLSKLNKKEDACVTFQQLKKEFPGEKTPVIQRAQQEMKQLGCR